jgi:hypothetical protein
MTLFFLFFGVMAIVLFLLQGALQRLEGQKEKPWTATLEVLYTVLFYGGALAVVAYPVFFVPSVPWAISITGGAVTYIFFLLLVHFHTAHRRARQARRSTMLSLLRGHVKARRIEKQVKEWNENYGM